MDVISCTFRRPIVSMSVYDKDLLVFFEEGNYTFLDSDSLRESVMPLSSKRITGDYPSLPSESMSISDNQPIQGDFQGHNTVGSRTSQPDLMKISTSEFLKMLQAQSEAPKTKTPISSENSSSKSDDDDGVKTYTSTRKRKFFDDQTDETNHEPILDSDPSAKQNPMENYTLQENYQKVLMDDSKRSKITRLMSDHGSSSMFIDEPLLNLTFTYGFYGCIILSKIGSLTYVHLVDGRCCFSGTDLSLIFENFIWKLCMNADTSDIILTLLHLHEKEEDKASFYMTIIKNIALVCSRKTIYADPSFLGAFNRLLQ